MQNAIRYTCQVQQENDVGLRITLAVELAILMHARMLCAFNKLVD